jgi:hypothetical protein
MINLEKNWKKRKIKLKMNKIIKIIKIIIIINFNNNSNSRIIMQIIDDGKTWLYNI